MPKVNHVKHARQRYAQVPVIDPETNEPKRSTLHKADGSPKLTKSGRPVTIPVMRNDTTKPLPMPTCDSCGERIEVGTPYKWIEPHGQRIRNRHESCPTWNVWEYSSSLSALIAQIQSTDIPTFEDMEEAESCKSDLASAIRELAEQKEESAQNIEDGFGHETEQSQELRDIAEQLNSWADEVESVDLPEFPEAGDVDCDDCGGYGVVGGEEDEDDVQCATCEGTGTIEGDEPTPEQIDEWSSEAQEAISSALENCPI